MAGDHGCPGVDVHVDVRLGQYRLLRLSPDFAHPTSTPSSLLPSSTDHPPQFKITWRKTHWEKEKVADGRGEYENEDGLCNGCATLTWLDMAQMGRNRDGRGEGGAPVPGERGLCTYPQQPAEPQKGRQWPGRCGPRALRATSHGPSHAQLPAGCRV